MLAASKCTDIVAWHRIDADRNINPPVSSILRIAGLYSRLKVSWSELLVKGLPVDITGTVSGRTSAVLSKECVSVAGRDAYCVCVLFPAEAQA